MGRWIVIHSLKSFSEHPDLIGVISAKDVAEPIYSPFARITKGDEIVYYATRDCVIVGIFRVMSGMDYVDDSAWGPSCIFKIVSDTLPPPGKVMDFKKLLQDPRTRFDLFPKAKYWASYLRGHACRPLTDRDFVTVKDAIRNPRFLMPEPGGRPQQPGHTNVLGSFVRIISRLTTLRTTASTKTAARNLAMGHAGYELRYDLSFERSNAYEKV